MDPDLVMQRLVAGLVFLGGAVVAGAVAIWLVGWLCRRLRLGNGLTLLAQLLMPVALFYAGSLYLDTAGVVAAAQVESKDESITYSSRIPGDWNRSFWATVRFASTDGPTQAVLWLDESTFDALRAGAALDVRYVPWFPLIARPAADSTRSLVPWRWLAPAGMVVCLGVALWVVLRRRAPAMMGIVFFAAIAGSVVWWVFPTPWVTPLEEPIVTTQAEVRDVHTATRAFVSGRGGRVDAPQPWHVVEVSFVPEGRDQPVLAVDSVDVGSVPTPTVGSRVAVRYNPRHPRDARLDGAHTWRWREWLALAKNIVLIVVLIGGFILLTRLAGFWWRKLTQPN